MSWSLMAVEELRMEISGQSVYLQGNQYVYN